MEESHVSASILIWLFRDVISISGTMMQTIIGQFHGSLWASLWTSISQSAAIIYTAYTIMNYNINSCGVLQSDIILKPGETAEFIYILGQKNNEEASAILNEYKKCGKVDSEIAKLKNYWHCQLSNFKVETRSEEFNNMINV